MVEKMEQATQTQERMTVLRSEQERVKHGLAHVSKDGEIYLDLNDTKTQDAIYSVIDRFATLASKI